MNPSIQFEEDATVCDLLDLFITDSIVDHIVHCTNKRAEKYEREEVTSPKSRVNVWRNTFIHFAHVNYKKEQP